MHQFRLILPETVPPKLGGTWAGQARLAHGLVCQLVKALGEHISQQYRSDVTSTHVVFGHVNDCVLISRLCSVCV